jgi:hypothetical protein
MIGGWWLCEVKEDDASKDEMVGRYIMPFGVAPITEVDLKRVKGHTSNPTEAILFVSTGAIPSASNVSAMPRLVVPRQPVVPSRP